MLEKRAFLFIAMKFKLLPHRLFSLAAALLLTLTLTGCQQFLSLLPLEQLFSPADANVTDQLPEEGAITLDTLPPWETQPYVELEYNIPAFTEDDISLNSFETYSSLDVLGRCGTAYALVGPETMPTVERGPIGQIKPSGWHTVRYDDLVDGKYLYNRCHLIGYQLTGENANEENLITGTRYLNVTGMLPFENMVADYVEETGNHVLYRVTPIFEGLELVARGVVMEAYSVEDDGEGLSFHVYVYNVQPGITIDYLTGESWLTDDPPDSGSSADASQPVETPPAPELPAKAPTADAPAIEERDEYTYILNQKSMKFHLPSCEGAQTMSEKNKGYFSGTREDALAQGYAPCGTCKP